MRAALRVVFGNRALNRIGVAYAGFNAAEWAVWIAVLVYAYDQGGATRASLAAVVQLVPAALFAPVAAQLADRRPPARVLTGGYLAQAAAMGLTALALLAAAPAWAVLACAALAASAATITRPAQAALVPALVRDVDELTAANVVLGWIESICLLVSPIVAGLLLAISGPGAVFAVMAAIALAAAGLVLGVRGPAAAAARDARRDRRAVLGELVAGAGVVGRDPQARLLTAVLAAQFVLIGALDVLFVVLAIDVLGLGDPGAGYLNAAFGLGGVVGLVATVRLIGRARLAPPLVAGAGAWSLALLLLGVWHTVPAAFALLAVAGAGRSLLDVAARTLLQRSAPAHVRARVYGVLETLDAIGLALGSVLVAVLVAALGAQGAAAGLGVLPVLVLLVAGRRLRDLDERADVPLVEIALLRSHPILSALGPAALESLARELTAVAVPAGECIIREGEEGRRYYVVAGGSLEISRAAVPIGCVGRGAGVGEVSLLARVPCTATVTAVTDAQVYAIEPALFVEVVTGHAASARIAERLVRDRLQASAST